MIRSDNSPSPARIFAASSCRGLPSRSREGPGVLLAVNRSDYPVIQAFAIYIAVITMIVNLLTDVLYKLVDPRVVLS